MQRYIVQRLLAFIPVVMFVGIFTFSLIHLAPGDPAALLGGQTGTREEIDKIRARLGLDKPLLQQFWIWTKATLRGDLGESVMSRLPIRELIFQRLPPSLWIGGAAEIFAVLVGVPLGVLAAWKANSWIDRTAMVFAVLAFSVPSFYLAYNLIFLFAVKLQLLPAIGYAPLSEGIGTWARSMVLPVVSIGLIIAGLLTRITRATLLEVLREDYIRTARAKGLAESTMLFRHALKNAFAPILTVIGLGIAGLITGLVVTETVFAIPGIGRLVVDSIQRRDYPVIQGLMLMIALSYMTINLFIDLLYAYIDPRIRY
ncbi:MAG: ABC transporter permease [Chloroflexi bacterium]|nr:ABC transporter permease [Chloroflexota bacterium]